MRTVALLTLASLTASPAFAGGFGAFLHGGFHTERAYYYANIDGDRQLTDPAEFPRFEQTQVLPQFGGGLEFILGDRDDKIIGIFRGYYSMETPQRDPVDTAKDVPSENVVANHRDKARHIGMASMGLNWGIIGDTDGALIGFSGHVGSGVLTNDQNEFFQVAIGPSMTYRLARSASFFAELHYTVRMRKQIDMGAEGLVGIRYMLD